MGTLDDAIREHLELKRRLGAPEDELEQKEVEAFGPTGAAQASPPPPQPSELEATEEQAPDDTNEQPEEHLKAAADEPGESWAPSAEEDLLERDEVLPEDSLEPNGSYAAPEPLPPPAAGGEPADLPLGEDEEEPEPSEDLLEETPEFLEETPEHDRLWFEQKPPKDFDLD